MAMAGITIITALITIIVTRTGIAVFITVTYLWAVVRM
jgi:hypothetical protein